MDNDYIKLDYKPRINVYDFVPCCYGRRKLSFAVYQITA